MDTLNGVLERLKDLESDPSFTLDKHVSSNKKTLEVLEKSYSLLASRKSDDGENTLDKLFIKHFDEEQIWQQLELKFNYISSSIPEIAKLHLAKEKLKFPFIDTEKVHEVAENYEGSAVEEDGNPEDLLGDDDSNSEEEEEEMSDVESHSSIVSDEKYNKQSPSKKNKQSPKSIVDDEFFKISEMEKYLDKMEKESLSGDDIDYFEDVPSDSESDTKEAKYDDFFRNPGSDVEDYNGNSEGSDVEKFEESMDEDDNVSEHPSQRPRKVRFSLNEDTGADDAHEENDTEKTSFESRELKLKQKIAKLEESNLSDKPWSYKGEVDASSRPVNSLLEEVLDVDLTVRPPPVFTEKVTFTLEQIIMNRIKDSAYDDVERKIKPVHVPHELKKELVLNQEKSKFSLAEVYEQEFLKRQPSAESAEPNNKLTPEKEKILKMMKSVFHKLDTLSNFHYTPKPVSADIEIVSNMPAITMEEVTPVAMSDANLLAPQEVGDHVKRKLLGKDERTKTDKRRERRKKKAFLSHKFKRSNKDNELSKTLKARNVSLALPNSESNLKSSTTFFKKLQEDSEVGVKMKKFKKKK